ncbi:MAG: hypothetical protein K0Q66_2285 [Chitinophagaceae bacterium]|nr:hypothetical protein [Chitinophagaceae bacterium]
MVILFRERSPASIIWLLLIAFGLHAHSFLEQPVVLSTAKDGLISYFFRQFLGGLSGLPVFFLYILLLLIQALRFNFVMNELRMFQHSNFLTAMAYIMFASLLPQWHTVSAALVANIFIIWIYSLILKLYNNKNPRSLLYNIGLITGLAMVSYHPLILMMLIVLFAVIVIRAFNVTEVFVLIVGLITPFYFLGAFLFVTDQWDDLIRYLPSWNFKWPKLEKDYRLILTWGVLLLCLLAGIFVWERNNRRMLIQSRKNWGVLLLMFVLFLPVPLVHYEQSVNAMLLWLPPLAAFTANAFLYPRKTLFPVILFWLIVLVSVYNNWLHS